MINTGEAKIRIGVAGWSIPKTHSQYFPESGTHLSRFARSFNCVEINSSFYREHQAKTYARWAQTTPDDFSFSVKLWRRFTHEQRLAIDEDEIRESVAGISELGPKLGVILIQLPPSLDFEARVARRFFTLFRKSYRGALAIEPRHQSWSKPAALNLLEEFKVSLVVADPERIEIPSVELASRAHRAGKIHYERLHGSPEIYRSLYGPERLDAVEQELIRSAKSGIECWCIFDNTTFGHAISNAADLRHKVHQDSGWRFD